MDELVCCDCGCEFEGWFPDNCTCPKCGSDDASIDDGLYE